jgi:hypothetical protein
MPCNTATQMIRGSVIASMASCLRCLRKSSSAHSACAITDSFSRSHALTRKHIASRQMQKLSEPMHQDVEPKHIASRQMQKLSEPMHQDVEPMHARV